MSETPIVQKVVVGVVVVNNGKALIVQRANDEKVLPGLWELPSGKRDPFEACVTTAVREVKEETGLSIEVISPISTFEYRLDKDVEIRDCVQINFLAKIKDVSVPKIEISHEHQAFAWVEESELEGREISLETRRTIVLGLQF